MIFSLKDLSAKLWLNYGIYRELFYWVIAFIVSDFIFLGYVLASYIAYKNHLYKYAHLKFIICTILLIFNFCFIGYGGYLNSKLPSAS